MVGDHAGRLVLCTLWGKCPSSDKAKAIRLGYAMQRNTRYVQEMVAIYRYDDHVQLC